MASVINLVNRRTKRPNGRRRIDFLDENRAPRCVYLGKMPERDADAIRRRVESIVAAKSAHDPLDSDVLEWLRKIGDDLAAKLAKAGLISPRNGGGNSTLGKYLDDYVAKRIDVKGGTATFYGHTRRCLVEYFGEDKPLRDITAGDADDWRRWLVTDQKLSDNTVRRRCGMAKQFFRAAVRARLIPENPFGDLKACSVRENRQRDYFVTREEARKVLDACPDAQWRLLFALSRYAGLRCPSEHLGLRLGDIDLPGGRMVVHSPKTEHHADGGVRVVPIFPELRPYLEEVWDQAEPGTEWVITRYRESNVNLRTQLQKIIKRAGLKPWPKLFQNLRATRATELVSEGWPEFKVCRWLGHTKLVAQKHYWQVTDDDFARASGAQQNAQWQPAVAPCKPVQAPLANPGNTRVCSVLHYYTPEQVGGTGLEPVTPSLSSWCSNQLS